MERPDLPAVGVPGDLQVDAVRDGAGDLLRLVGQQQHRQVRVGAGERGGVVGVVAGHAGAGGGPVVDPGDDQPGAAAVDHQVPVVQRLPAERRHVVDPALGLAEVLVVAGHVHPGQPGPDVAERRGLLAALRRPRRRRCRRCAQTMSASSALTTCDDAAPTSGPGRSGRSGCRSAAPPGSRPGRRPAGGSCTSTRRDPGHPHRLGVPPEQQDQRDTRDHRGDDRASGPGRRPRPAPGPAAARCRAATRRTAPRPRRAWCRAIRAAQSRCRRPCPREHQHRERDQRDRERPPCRPRRRAAGQCVARPHQRPPRHAEQQRQDAP